MKDIHKIDISYRNEAIARLKASLQGVCKLYTLFLVIVLYSRFISIQIFDMTSIVLDLLLYFVLLISLVSKNNYGYELWVFLTLAIISVMNPVARNMFLIISVVYLMNQFSLKQIALINVIMSFIILGIVALLLEMDIIHNTEMRFDYINDKRIRNDFGMGNPNMCALFVFGIVSNLYYLLCKKNPVLLFGIILMACIVVGNYTASRTFQLSCVILMTFPLMKVNFIKRIILKYKKWFWVGILSFLALYMFMVYKVQMFRLLDFMLSGRLTLANEMFAKTGLINLFVGSPAVKYITIDNSYFHLMFEAGIIVFVLFMYMFVITVKNLNGKNIYLFPLIFAYVVYGFGESVFTNIMAIGNILLLWNLLYDEYLKNRKPKQAKEQI